MTRCDGPWRSSVPGHRAAASPRICVPTCRPGWCAPLTPTAAHCCGPGTRCLPQAPGAGAGGEDTYRRSTASTWSVFSTDPAAQPGVHPHRNAQVGLYGTTRDVDGRDYYASSVVALDAADARSCGISRRCITTFGTTTCRRSRCCSISRLLTGRCRRSAKRPSRAICSSQS